MVGRLISFWEGNFFQGQTAKLQVGIEMQHVLFENVYLLQSSNGWKTLRKNEEKNELLENYSNIYIPWKGAIFEKEMNHLPPINFQGLY